MGGIEESGGFAGDFGPSPIKNANIFTLK